MMATGEGNAEGQQEDKHSNKQTIYRSQRNITKIKKTKLVGIRSE